MLELVQRIPSMQENPTNMAKMKLFIIFIIAVVDLCSFSQANVLRPNTLYKLEESQYLKQSLTDNETDPFVRLPLEVLPDSYELYIHPDLKNFTFNGNVTIIAKALKANNSITLHAGNLILSNQRVMDDYYGNIFISGDKKGELYVMSLKRSLTVNKNYTISMTFSGILSDDLDGLYRSSYISANNETEWIAVTQFEAMSARKAFPCFDEPALKAKFTVNIGRDKNMTSLSNMPLKGTINDSMSEDIKWDMYEESPYMSSYLVAFTVSKFNSKSANLTYEGKEPKLVSVWTPGKSNAQTDWAVEFGPKILRMMENITNIDFALPKMDMIGIPDFRYGAMENWGLVTFRETDLLYENGISSASSKQRVATVIAHEFAHQWFGDLVTPEWWKYIWLSEGFATYFMYIATDLVNPEWRLVEQLVVEQTQTAFLSDSLESTRPITSDEIPGSIMSLFDQVAYNKAGSVIRMMEHILGRKTFFAGINRYLNTCKFSTGNNDKLFDAMGIQPLGVQDQLGNVNFKNTMKNWIYQKGYPLITVERDYPLGLAVIKQERFFSDKSANVNDTSRWSIPITFTTEDSPNFVDTLPRYWITDDQDNTTIDSLPISEGWIIFNILATGFYRVNYDDKNWNLITKYLNSEKHPNIPPLNKAQLISDSLNLARGGYINYTIALELTNYLSDETDFLPWYAAYSPFDFLAVRLYNSTTKEKYNVHMNHLLIKYYDSVEFNNTPSSDPIISLSRSQILPWACKFDNDDCLTTAKSLFVDFQNNTSIAANLKSTVYCFGVASGGKEEWDFLWNLYVQTTVASEKALIMNALGCSRDEEILVSYLDKTITDDSGIRRQDRTIVFNSVISRAEGVNVAISYVTKHFNQLTAAYGVEDFGSLIVGLANRISSQQQIKEMTELLESNKAILGAFAKQANDTINRNIDWNDMYLPVIESWLNEKYPSSSNANSACVLIILTLLCSNYFL